MEKLTDLLIVGLFAYGSYKIYEEYNKQNQYTEVSQPTYIDITQPVQNNKVQEQINEVVKNIQHIKNVIAIAQAMPAIVPGDIQKKKLELAKYLNLYEQLTGMPYEITPPSFSTQPISGTTPSKLFQPIIRTDVI